MKKDLNIIEAEKVCNGKEARISWMRSVGAEPVDEVLAMSEEQWQRYRAHMERVLREPPTCGVMQFPDSTGRWQTVKQEGMNDTTAIGCRD